MDEEMLKVVAGQLRQPAGDLGLQVGGKMNLSNEGMYLITIHALRPSPGDSILEIGTGNGQFVKQVLLHNPSVTYTGVDFSSLMIDESIKRNLHFITKGQASFCYANAAKLPFESESFTKVFSINTIYFWRNTKKIFSEINRVLKPAGSILITIRPRAIMEHYPFTKYGFRLFSRHELANLLAENNFHVVDIIEQDEPDVDVMGVMMPAKTLLVEAQKI